MNNSDSIHTRRSIYQDWHNNIVGYIDDDTITSDRALLLLNPIICYFGQDA